VLRRALVALIVVSVAAPAHADDHVAVEAAEEMGFLAASHARVTGSYGRRLFANRWFVEARGGVGVGTFSDLVVLDQRLGFGIVLGGGRAVEALLGLRLGVSYVTGELNGASFHKLTPAGEIAPMISVAIERRWRLRFSPILPTLFWGGDTYAASIGVEIGADYAL